MSKYVYKDIKKEINGNIYEVGYVTFKIDESLDNFISEKIKNNDYFSTHYVIYKNNKFFYSMYGENLSKEELLIEFNNTLDKLLYK